MMKRAEVIVRFVLAGILLLSAVAAIVGSQWQRRILSPPLDGREEVVFWHFWGGKDRAVVEDVVRRFNDSNDSYRVRAVAMPGNNLDVKLFLSISGGSPPDLINQDDPLIADWAQRGAIMPISNIAPAAEVAELREFLFPAAIRLTEFEGELFGVCNGLDVRTLYYNKTLLDEHDLPSPKSIDELDALARQLTVRDASGQLQRVGYLPDARRLWAWGVVFGGDFYDEATGEPTADDPQIINSLRWMAGASERLDISVNEIQAFRQGDQSLPGKPFPLLPINDETTSGRYAAIMDGQWRVRDIVEFQRVRQEKGLPAVEFGVCPLPPPADGRMNAGWVNGNYFLVPRGARHHRGAWEFIKFWIGMQSHQSQAAKTCAAGGWIPVSQRVVDDQVFQAYLAEQPLFAEFVQLAGSENQQPIPVAPGAPFLNREVKQVGETAMSHPERSSGELLKAANDQLRERMKKATRAQ